MDINWGLIFCLLILLLALWSWFAPAAPAQTPAASTINISVTPTTPAVATATPASSTSTATPTVAAATTAPAAAAAATQEFMTTNWNHFFNKNVAHAPAKPERLVTTKGINPSAPKTLFGGKLNPAFRMEHYNNSGGPNTALFANKFGKIFG